MPQAHVLHLSMASISTNALGNTPPCLTAVSHREGKGVRGRVGTKAKVRAQEAEGIRGEGQGCENGKAREGGREEG
jgi:hypothetical protein